MRMSGVNKWSLRLSLLLPIVQVLVLGWAFSFNVFQMTEHYESQRARGVRFQPYYPRSPAVNFVRAMNLPTELFAIPAFFIALKASGRAAWWINALASMIAAVPLWYAVGAWLDRRLGLVKRPHTEIPNLVKKLMVYSAFVVAMIALLDCVVVMILQGSVRQLAYQDYGLLVWSGFAGILFGQMIFRWLHPRNA
jgi:hypothetical protein